MTPERWQKIEQVLQTALDHDPADRAGLLDRECAGDADLREEVESLLSTADHADGFLNANVMSDAALLLADELPNNSLLGRHIGPYLVKTRLGAGGMGEVYLAEDVRLGRRVALKLLDPGLASDAQSRMRFLREARLASLLDHPNICAVHEVGESRGRPYIAMQFVEGETLRTVIDGSPLKLEALLSISLQVAEALAAAHSQGIVHRDIKAGNIMVTPNGQVKVLDFGLAKLLERETQPDTNVTASGTVIGTPSSMSPEQARGERADERSDIFSFGVVIYEMATGCTPFEGQTYADVVSSLLKSSPSPVVEVEPGMPQRLSFLIDKALQKDPASRYQSMSEMITDLKQVVREVGGLDRLFHSSDSAGIMPLVRRSPMQKTTRSWVKRSIAFGIPTLCLVLLAAGVYGFWRYNANRSSLMKIGPALHFAEGRIKQLTTNGKVSWAALSPDGEFYAFVLNERDDTNESLWLGQTDSSNPIQLRSAVGKYHGLAFSPDSKSLYFTLNGPSEHGLFRMPVLGGVAEKLSDKFNSKFSLSPDGKRIAFLRNRDNESVLAVANPDGREERELSSRPVDKGFLVNCLAWSPDGSMIATAAATDALRESREIYVVNIANGNVTQLTSFEWTRVSGLVWTQDGSSLILVGTDKTETRRQLWEVTYPGGQPRRLSRDIDGYGAALSLSKDGKSLVAVQQRRDSNIWIAAGSDLTKMRQFTFSSINGNYGFNGIDWMPDGGLIFTASVDRNVAIYSIDANGSNIKQITSAGFFDHAPKVTSDGRFVVFQSNRTQSSEIWRVGVDGSNLRQLTANGGNSSPALSPDGKWVVYNATVDGKTFIHRVSIEGGQAIPVGSKAASEPSVSPDGKFIACLYNVADNSPIRVAILNFSDGSPVKVFEVAASARFDAGIHWAADGRAFFYRDYSSGLWKQMVTGGEPSRVKVLPDEEILNFTWSRDGKSFAFTRARTISDVVLLREQR